MSPEDVKFYADIVISVLTATGFSSIALAYIGMKKAKKDRTEEDDRPSIGMAGMNNIGSMIASDSHVTMLSTALSKMAEVQREASEKRHAESTLTLASDEQNRAASRRLVEELENIGRKLQRLDETLERRR